MLLCGRFAGPFAVISPFRNRCGFWVPADCCCLLLVVGWWNFVCLFFFVGAYSFVMCRSACTIKTVKRVTAVRPSVRQEPYRGLNFFSHMTRETKPSRSVAWGTQDFVCLCVCMCVRKRAPMSSGTAVRWCGCGYNMGTQFIQERRSQNERLARVERNASGQRVLIMWRNASGLSICSFENIRR